MDQKINYIDKKVEGLVKIPEKIEENCKTFKEVLRRNIPSSTASETIRTVINDDRNLQLIQNQQRKLRSNNLIIHGVKEENDHSDEDFVKEFTKDLGTDFQPKLIQRLGTGTAENNKIRPLRITMNTEEEKDKIMSRLPNLKNSRDRIKKITVTEDYTVEERQEIKKWVTRAKEKTKEENDENITWKVRGTPKNGLRLVKITKQ